MTIYIHREQLISEVSLANGKLIISKVFLDGHPRFVHKQIHLLDIDMRMELVLQQTLSH